MANIYLGIFTGKQKSPCYKETWNVKYHYYALENGQELGLPVKSSYTLEAYLAEHEQNLKREV